MFQGWASETPNLAGLVQFQQRAQFQLIDKLEEICYNSLMKKSGGNQWVYPDGQTHYQKNKDYYIKRNKERKALLRDKANIYKSEKGCKDCGEKDYEVLDFDHLNDKKDNVSNLIMRGQSWDNILKEIEKCEVVCSNCHRKRTAKRLRS